MENTNVTNTKNAGGIAVYHSRAIIINNCCFLSNSAVQGGALYFQDVSHISISGTSFIKNEASSVGGAVALLRSDIVVNIDNITCIANQARQGGCLYMTSTTLVLKNSDIKQNLVDDYGAAVVMNGPLLQVSDKIIAQYNSKI